MQNTLCRFIKILACFFLFMPGFALRAQELTPGVIHTIQCAADSSNQYSFYLPKSYDAQQKYPLLLFLDPSARGNVPVEKYKQVADELGLILAGSFNSKNFDAASSINSIPGIIKDVMQRASIDASKKWLAGFSGGSRMASSYAATYEGITGVIGCGAGFAGPEFLTGRQNIPYAGIAGNTDMNLEEMVTIKEQLTNRNKDNLLLFFDGGHEWPPAIQVKLAAAWLQKTGTVASMHNEIPALLLQLNQYREAGLDYYAWLAATEFKKIPALITVADSAAKQAETVKNFKKQQEQFETVLEEERNFMDQVSFLYEQTINAGQGMTANDDTWKQKAAAIAELKRNKNAYKQLSGERLFDFCWRLCGEQYFWLQESKRYREAYRTAYILSFFDDTRRNPDYMMAKAAAGLADKPLCMQHLKKAVKNPNLTKQVVLRERLITTLIDIETIERLFK